VHIKKIELRRFKQFNDAAISLKDELSLVVGGNNSGKSSLLQALATWEFCKTLLEIEKGREAWCDSATNQGVGMGIVDFTPMQGPSLAHLWSNLKSQKIDEADGYTLKIKVWWDNAADKERYLEIGMSLVNDRLFVKNTASNIKVAEVVNQLPRPPDGAIPAVAYLPPFAGVTDRESRLTPAMRGRLVGQGLSGGIIRNTLFDLYSTNQLARSSLPTARRDAVRIAALAELALNDPWEILQDTMRKVFKVELKIVPFNERYHSYLKIECIKGEYDATGKFKRHPGFNSRDLMVEGSGFLQWLSVFALTLTPGLDCILLDEPDAHLHPALQLELVGRVRDIARKKSKQVLLATHSPELIRVYEYSNILVLHKQAGQYLTMEESKVRILAGIGTIHTPTLHSLMKNKRVLFVEGESDITFFKILAQRAGLKWPENLTPWIWPGKPTERRMLFEQLSKEIKGLKGLSIRDRDDDADGTVKATLIDNGYTHGTKHFTVMKWRRRHVDGAAPSRRLCGLPARVR
jgi:predicted ATPase